MKLSGTYFPVAICTAMLFSVSSLAQTPEPRQKNSTPQAQQALPELTGNSTSIDTVANELGLLRKSLQTLNTRLHEISEKVLASDSNEKAPTNYKQKAIAANLDLLTRVEQRAEIMRKQLIELMEKKHHSKPVWFRLRKICVRKVSNAP